MNLTTTMRSIVEDNVVSDYIDSRSNTPLLEDAWGAIWGHLSKFPEKGVCIMDGYYVFKSDTRFKPRLRVLYSFDDNRVYIHMVELIP